MMSPGKRKPDLVSCTFAEQPDGSYVTSLRGQAVLQEPLLNKGTAFSPQERAELGLDGLLPPMVESLDEQARRTYAPPPRRNRQP